MKRDMLNPRLFSERQKSVLNKKDDTSLVELLAILIVGGISMFATFSGV